MAEMNTDVNSVQSVPSVVKIKRVMSKFSQFLNQFLHQKDSQLLITNTRIGDKTRNIYGGSYHIPDDKYRALLKIYRQEIVMKALPEYLTEKQLDKGGPILIDIDLRYTYEVTERIHTTDHINDLIFLYLDELKIMFQWTPDIHVPIFVFEKPRVNRLEDKKVTKDGIHMIIGLQADHKTQMILRDRVVAKIAGIWCDLPITNTWQDVFDQGISKGHTNWQLYGSRKPNNDAYKLTRVCDIHVDDEGEFMMPDTPTSVYENDDEKFAMLSVRYTNHAELFMTTKFAEEYTASSAGTRPQVQGTQGLISSSSSSSSSSVPPTAILAITNAAELQTLVQHCLESLEPMDYELREAYEYTMILPKSFWGPGSFTKWIRVGWALRNISDRLFIVWVAFSAQDPAFDYRSIRNDLWGRWNDFATNTGCGLTKRSIMYWAKQEVPDAFNQVNSTSIDHYVDLTLERLNTMEKSTIRGSGDFDIASVLYHLYKDEYVCVSVKNNIWYRFQEHKWTEIDSGTTLRLSISRQLRDIYTAKVNKINRQVSMMDAEDDRAKGLRKRAEIITSICDRLSRTSDKKNIMIEAKELFYDSQFFEKLDMNPYLLCFKNGVIDFSQQTFRRGNPEDYLSKCTNISYKPLDSHDSPVKGEIEDFMHKLFPNGELHKYMWDHLASCLLGTCEAQTINMYIGVGQNGKSVLVNLMEQVLGEYKGDVPLTLITQQRTKIGGLAPELVQLKGTRYAVIQEPSKGDKINEGIMKQLTGGDPVQARAPYMTQIMTYVPQFKLVLCTNELMEIKSQDHGTWRRIRVVGFESLFTENPRDDDPQKPFQFKLDTSIKEKFAFWKEAFASMLVNHAFKTKGKVCDCARVLEASNKYKESQDVVAAFIAEKISREPTRCVRKDDIAEVFKDWYEVNYGTFKSQSLKDVHATFDKEFGKSRDGMWLGIRLKPKHAGDLITGGGDGVGSVFSNLSSGGTSVISEVEEEFVYG